MLQDTKLTREKLNTLWRDPGVETLPTKRRRYAIISDLHLGDGGQADDFQHNEPAVLKALSHYKANRYHLILLGDVEEFWQFELDKIVARYGKTVYNKIKSFGDNRVYRVFGNHDSEWANMTDPVRNHSPKVQFASEALKLADVQGRPTILLVHGHQGTKNSDKVSWATRFFVRLFKPVKPVARRARLYSHPSATKSRVARSFEKSYYSWAKDSGVIVICGHTHRAMFASKSYADRLEDAISNLEADLLASRTANKISLRRKVRKLHRLRRALEDEERKERAIDPTEANGEPLPCYFNAGCSLYTDGITTIEIENDEIRLVKWWNEDNNGKPFEVYDRGSITEFAGRLNGTSEFKKLTKRRSSTKS